MRVVVFDRTCPRLARVWDAGTRIFGALGTFDAWYGAYTWTDALMWLARVERSRTIREIQYWGHGRWGRVMLAKRPLGIEEMGRASSTHARELAAVRERMDERSLVWFRTCETFGTRAGHDFARAWTDFFGCRAAGHTFVIHAVQSGLHSLAPGETPRWSIDEGVHDGRAMSSRIGAVNTITLLTHDLPRGY
jgi:hypothetical protein